MIQMQTFGAVDLRRDGVAVRSVLTQPKRMALLAHLLLGSPSGFLHRDAVLARFWPDADDERARNSLRQALHQLRRSLGDDLVESRGEEIGCRPGAVECDALAFVQELEAGRLEAAMRHYRGEFLPAFFVEDAPEIESWVDAQRGWYRRQAFQAAGALADREAAGGEVKAALLWARQASDIEPCDESAARRLIRLLAATGEAAAALAAYEEFAARLRREHEIEPSPETRAAAEAVRQAARPAPAPLPVPGSARATAAAAPIDADGQGAGSPATTHAPGTSSVSGPHAAAAEVSAATAAPAPVGVLLPAEGRSRRLLRRHRVSLVAGLAAIVALAGWYTRATPPAPSAPATVAVLPFANLTGEPTADYLADGMAEELLAVLARVPGLRLAARTSSFHFKGSDVPVDSVARALGVAHVVEGSVRASGSRLRVTVQLIDAASGLHRWSETYDRDAHDLLAVQAEIARAIAKSLQVELSPAVARPAASETRDPEAYRLLLRANQVNRSGSTREVLAETRALLEEALRRDPSYARALAALANAISWQANFRYIEADSGYARARRLAERSLALAPTVEAHLVLARDAELVHRDTAAADAHYRSALALQPRDPRTLQFHALFLSRTGRVDEGIALARQAVELDPLYPGSHNNLAVTLMAADRAEEAREAYEEALRVSPEDPVILGNLANLMSRQQRWDEALAYLDRALVRTPEDVQTLAQRTSTLLRAGRRDEGMAMLHTLEQRPDFPHYRLAILYTNVGDVEKILEHLEHAVAEREDGLLALRSPDAFRGLRTHPRFVKLLEQIGE